MVWGLTLNVPFFADTLFYGWNPSNSAIFAVGAGCRHPPPTPCRHPTGAGQMTKPSARRRRVILDRADTA
jgi:hypothetical protein